MTTIPSRIVRLSSTGPSRETDYLLGVLGKPFENITDAEPHMESPLPSKAVHVDLASAVGFPPPNMLATFDTEGVTVRLYSEMKVAADLKDFHRWLCRTFQCGETIVDQETWEFTLWVNQAPPEATEA